MRLQKPPAWLRAAWDNIDDLEQLVAAHGNHVLHASTHCSNGHLRSPDVVRTYGCRLCRSESNRLSNARAAIARRTDIDHVVVARLLTNPDAWRALNATTDERYAAARVLGASSWKILGINGGRLRSVA
jgi:hypothetical protein